MFKMNIVDQQGDLQWRSKKTQIQLLGGVFSFFLVGFSRANTEITHSNAWPICNKKFWKGKSTSFWIFFYKTLQPMMKSKGIHLSAQAYLCRSSLLPLIWIPLNHKLKWNLQGKQLSIKDMFSKAGKRELVRPDNNQNRGELNSLHV